ncbi:MAG: DNA polymerase III subunit delta [Candidatus Coatesbacteria bacterium]|nr:MAG: DNA polymerase III subunit delta [Candidatus Coatesbacteria bacterium]
MTADLRGLADDLREGKTLPLYFFEGEDEYRKRRALERVREVALGGGDKAAADVAYEFLDAPLPDEIIERASTGSFFAERKLIAVVGAETYGKEAAPVFESYADSASGDAIVILLARGKADRRGKLFKSLDGRGLVFSFPYLTGGDRRRRIAKEAENSGMKLDGDALDYLDYVLSPDLYTITNEMEKLRLFRGSDGGEVTLDDVKNVVAVSRVESIFDAVRFVGEGRGQRAMEAIGRLLDSGENELAILSLLARQAKLFWQAKVLAESGAPPREIAEKLGVPWRYVDEYVDGGRRLPEWVLARMHRSLTSLDFKVKTGAVEPRLAIEMFAAQAASPAVARTN